MIQFPRKTRMFRGEFQAGPFAAVFLLFLIFFTFTTSIVYIPGLPLKLEDAGLRLSPSQIARVELENGPELRFGKDSFPGFDAFEKRLREECRTNKALKLLVVQAPPMATNDVAQRVVGLAQELRLMIDLPGRRLDLPASDSLLIVTNPTLTVLINLAGEVYFESQVVPDDKLQPRLAAAVRESPRPPILLVLADKTVSYEKLAQVGNVARSAGIDQVILATRPPLYGSSRTP